VDRHAAHLATDELAFAHVDPDPDADPEWVKLVHDRGGAGDGLCRPVEGGEKPVAGGINLVATRLGQLTPDNGVVARNELLPRTIPERGGPLR
jgi:hypothetical protein